MLSCPCRLLWRNMNRTPLRCQKRLAQPLTEGWMRVDRRNNFISRQLIAHCNRIFRNQVRRIGTDDMRPYKLVVLAKNDLDEAFSMTTPNGLAIGGPRKALHAHLTILLFRLLLRQAVKRSLSEWLTFTAFHFLIQRCCMSH